MCVSDEFVVPIFMVEPEAPPSPGREQPPSMSNENIRIHVNLNDFRFIFMWVPPYTLSFIFRIPVGVNLLSIQPRTISVNKARIVTGIAPAKINSG